MLIVTCFYFLVKDLRKTLSVIKIEKEDIETALNDCRRELQQLEQKNKVHDSKSEAQWQILLLSVASF